VFPTRTATGCLSWPPDSLADGRTVPRLVLDDLVDPADAHRHDQARLAAALIRLVEGDSRARRRAAGGARTAGGP
jgi:hypothetical protein